ncbi:mechanosensitive ion channel protein MscS [Stutzerimonas xanthomarina]|uniref:mechanosensitive ion channel family protein n=1 Tax=Stutzerimonas nitrititolerans TaxID=2482751 RepID=UPI0008244669|nr:mechanosensitive ion channel domain-containing protein [Stutzerimonas nitrititolerans]OCX16648.1 mechanosensitive ion channel protein MscS [Stutzerimonas xanthomarina]
MDVNIEYLVGLSEAWLPIVLQYSAQLLLALITFLIGWWLINKLTGRLGALLRRRQVDPSLHGFIESLAGVALKILLLISVASMVGVETTSFIAMIGAAGLAVGLALQGSLANFAGGVLILLFRPFRVGEWIEAQGVAGTVHSIQIFHTVLKSADNKTIVVPNGSLSNGHITNYSREQRRRADINVGIAYSADIRLARKILLEIAEDARVLRDPEPVVFVTGLGESAVNLSLRVWVATGDFWSVTFAFTEQLKERFAEAGIGVPLPRRELHVVQG